MLSYAKVQNKPRVLQSLTLGEADNAGQETAHRILQEVEQGVQATPKIADGEVGRVKIGFTEATLFSLAPDILKTYPQIELIVTDGGTETHVEALRTHQIDVGFVYLPIREPSPAIRPSFEEACVAALPTPHLLC